MVKRKSFWLTLLAVLTAAALVFCACGLVGCSSDSDVDKNPTSNPTETEDDGTLVLQGMAALWGQEAWTVVTLKPDYTATMCSYDENGETDENNAGDITWEYVDDAKTEISGTMYAASMPGFPVPVSFALKYVDGKVVAATYHINYVNADFNLYEKSVVAALESSVNVGSAHAQVVLHDDLTCTVVMDGKTSYGEWDWTGSKSGVSVTVGGSTYETSSIESSTGYNQTTQITEAVFEKFGTSSNVTFKHICDDSLADTTLYSFVSSEGYTLVLYQNGTYETTVGSETYTGTYGRDYTLYDDDDESLSYSPTSTADADGNVQFTFGSYYGGATNVVFILEENFTSREDSTNYQTYYNSVEHGTAIAVLTGKAYSTTDNTEYTEGGEYWLFLYKDGAFVAHVNDTSTTKSDGVWTWSEETEGAGLVPTFTRNPGSTSTTSPEVISYAVQDSDGTWSVAIKGGASDSSYLPQYGMGIYWVYTFTTEEMPAGAFEGTTTSGSTVYLVLNGDGTFTAHIGSTYTSDGVWSKDTQGDMEFYKTDSNNNYAISSICTVSKNSDGTLSVGITNFLGSTNTYIVDPSVVPVGGHVYTDEEKAQIENLKAA